MGTFEFPVKHHTWIQKFCISNDFHDCEEEVLCKTVLDDSKCDFNNEKLIGARGALEEFNCFMKCELEEALFLK